MIWLFYAFLPVPGLKFINHPFFSTSNGNNPKVVALGLGESHHRRWPRRSWCWSLPTTIVVTDDLVLSCCGSDNKDREVTKLGCNNNKV